MYLCDKLLKIRLILTAFYICITGVVTSQVVIPDISITPLMGWSSWNNFNVKITESVIKGQVDGMVSSGLEEAGYTYVNIDDGFFAGRYPDGTLRVDTIKFPGGMKAIADYIHSKNLKAGFYSDVGTNTCSSIYRFGKGGIGAGLCYHEEQDINLVLKIWSYDYLKVDFCGGKAKSLDERNHYTAIKSIIDSTIKRDIVYNVCRWNFPGTWVTKIADSWRISGDIIPYWPFITHIIDKNTYLAAYVSPGHFNDMDMLEVGRGLTAEEDKSHFSMWCILSSPLILGNDLTKITQQTKNILTNAEVIAVNQDTTGVQAHLISSKAGLQVWGKNLNGRQSRERAVALLNRRGKAAAISVKWKDLNLFGAATVRDLWLHKDLGIFESMYMAIVPSHGVVMLKVVGEQSKLQDVFEAEYAWVNNFNLRKNSVLVRNQGRVLIDKHCSGRAKVGWLGNRADNYIEFRDIYTNNPGVYHLKISYLSGKNRNAKLSVNGEDTLLTNLNSGGWSTVDNIAVKVILKKGYNTIRFSNPTDWLPDFDKIQLDLNDIPDFN
jgi:hypothetical protein